MWTRSQAFDTAASWSPWALLARPGSFSGDYLLFSQENQEIDWACLCKPSPHLRITQPRRNQHLWSEDNWQECAWNSMGTFSLSFAFLCSLGTH